jgi:hypothetical protein
MSSVQTKQMNKKHIVAGLIGFAVILGWNIFLIQRDNALYKAHYRQSAIDNLQKPAPAEIK